MNDPSSAFQAAAVDALNATSASLHIIELLRSNGVSAPDSAPAFLVLMEWAVENIYTNQFQGQEEYGLMVRAALESLETVYENLFIDDLEGAVSLQDAAEKLATNLGDVIDDRGLPPDGRLH